MNVRLIENCDFDEDGEFLGSDSHFSNDLACNDADDFPDETVLDEIEDEGHQFEDDEEFLDEEYFQPSLPRDGQRRAFQVWSLKLFFYVTFFVWHNFPSFRYIS